MVNGSLLNRQYDLYFNLWFYGFLSLKCQTKMEKRRNAKVIKVIESLKKGLSV